MQANHEPDRKLSIFERIRAACRKVSEEASSVRIDPDGVRNAAQRLCAELTRSESSDTGEQPVANAWDGMPGDSEATAALAVTLDAINFGSGWFPHLRKRASLSGYNTIAALLTEHVRKHGSIPAERLATVTAEDCARLFAQDPANADAFELMTLFAQAWNDLGNDLLRHHNGRFLDFIDAAEGSAARWIEQLCRQPFFHDESPYGDRIVPFYKRAQIAASDLHLAFHGQGPGRFEDIDELTMFADNLVPHVLRLEGVLCYRPELLQRIEHGELIPHDAPEEVELRACALHAVELLTSELRACGIVTSPRRLDMILWNRGQGALFKASPRHRTRCVFY